MKKMFSRNGPQISAENKLKIKELERNMTEIHGKISKLNERRLIAYRNNMNPNLLAQIDIKLNELNDELVHNNMLMIHLNKGDDESGSGVSIDIQ